MTPAGIRRGDETELSIVVPVFRCTSSLRELTRRVFDALESVVDGVELILVDDGSEDDAWAVIRDLATADERVHGVRLSRNFGQHAAITAGIGRASGAWIAVMDGDLQDPPEDLPRFYAKAAEGYEIVFGKRRRDREPWLRRLLSKVYFGLLGVFTGVKLESEYGTFSMMSRNVAEAFLRFDDRNRHYLLILRWLGFTRTDLEYVPAPRTEGQSSYTVRALIRHAIEGIFFQTTVLLRWVIYIGFVIALAGVGAAVYFTVARLSGTAYPGWTSLIVIMLVLSGVIIVSMGVIGLYVGEVFNEVRGRPLYVVEDELNVPVRSVSALRD